MFRVMLFSVNAKGAGEIIEHSQHAKPRTAAWDALRLREVVQSDVGIFIRFDGQEVEVGYGPRPEQRDPDRQVKAKEVTALVARIVPQLLAG